MEADRCAFRNFCAGSECGDSGDVYQGGESADIGQWSGSPVLLDCYVPDSTWDGLTDVQRVNSTTVNLILTLRKALSLAISVWYYGSGFSLGMGIGGGLVLRTFDPNDTAQLLMRHSRYSGVFRSTRSISGRHIEKIRCLRPGARGHSFIRRGRQTVARQA